jgi:hypothetical protein
MFLAMHDGAIRLPEQFALRCAALKFTALAPLSMTLVTLTPTEGL